MQLLATWRQSTVPACVFSDCVSQEIKTCFLSALQCTALDRELTTPFTDLKCALTAAAVLTVPVLSPALSGLQRAGCACGTVLVLQLHITKAGGKGTDAGFALLVPLVLALAGIHSIFFPVAGVALCFGFSMRRTLTTH